MSMTEYTQNETVAYLSGKSAGEQEERERIIALLEEVADRNYEYPGDYEVYYGVSAVLPLIKGESDV